MDDFDRLPIFEPLTPRVAAPEVVPTDPPAPASRPATSSRPASPTGRGLVGVLAISLVTATLASAVTVGVLTAGNPAAPSGLGATAPGAPTTPVTISADDAVVAVAESASPAVVTITTDSGGNGDFGPFSMPSTGVGSGFIFDANGLILTNDHVIADATGSDAITVTFQDGSELPATIVATDPDHDLAVIKVEASGLPTIDIGDSDALKVGQLVVAIGSPLGTFTESVTSGILSATGRTIEVGVADEPPDLDDDRPPPDRRRDQRGQLGRPAARCQGKVIGVNVAVAASAQGIGFAVPIDAAAAIIAEARAATDVA